MAKDKNSLAAVTEELEKLNKKQDKELGDTMKIQFLTKKRNELSRVIQHSLVIGFDYYYYSKKYWLHSWGNLLPYHYNDGGEFSYHNYNDGEQWYDYSGGVIFGRKIDKQLGIFAEGKYSKYWNREWYDFKFGVNYIIR